MIDTKKLEFWLAKQKNVLFIGEAGTGKTAVTKELFTQRFGEMGKKWLYFSASTMDAWVDFIGVPREAKDEKGSFLELVMPRVLRDDEIEAIFMDEFNRAPKKVRNAVMELIQFKSINGRRFRNLKVIWAAINPHDDNETYDVDRLDPAQIDRFHIHYQVPYKVDRKYFDKKFGKPLASAAILWWEQIPEEQRKKVSPRRLDYALEIYKEGGSLRGDVLDPKTGVEHLMDKLNGIDKVQAFSDLITNGDEVAIRKFIAQETNYSLCQEYIVENPGDTLKYLNRERVAALASKHKKVKSFIEANQADYGSLLSEKERAEASETYNQWYNFWNDKDLTFENYREKSKEHLGRTMRFRRMQSTEEINKDPRAAFEDRRQRMLVEYAVPPSEKYNAKAGVDSDKLKGILRK